jgi:hypothetical protein
MNCIIFNKDVSHRVHVASEHGEGYDGNNPLKRLILPLTLTPEAEMQFIIPCPAVIYSITPPCTVISFPTQCII